MNQTPGSPRKKNRLWKIFASLKFTVWILVILAAASVIGTVVPQSEEARAFFKDNHPLIFHFFESVNLFDMYHAIWFQFLLLLLALNILVCTWDRLPAVMKIAFKKQGIFSRNRFTGFPHKESFTTYASYDALAGKCEDLITRRFRTNLVESEERFMMFFGESGRFAKTGVYIVHLSVLVLLLGALVGSIWGFEGYIRIPENEEGNIVSLRRSEEKIELDFSIFLKDFNVSFYRDGRPKEFLSEVEIRENGKAVKKGSIRVNHPLHYRGISIFQSNYGQIPFAREEMKNREVTLSVIVLETGFSYQVKAKINEKVTLPEQLGEVELTDFMNHWIMGQRNLGEAFTGTYTKTDGTTEKIVLPVHFRRFDMMRQGEVMFYISDYATRYYTGLQVNRDPGYPLVYLGFLLMIIGFVITFYIHHKRVGIALEDKGDQRVVTIYGHSDRNPFSMSHNIKKLADKLKNT